MKSPMLCCIQKTRGFDKQSSNEFLFSIRVFFIRVFGYQLRGLLGTFNWFSSNQELDKQSWIRWILFPWSVWPNSNEELDKQSWMGWFLFSIKCLVPIWFGSGPEARLIGIKANRIKYQLLILSLVFLSVKKCFLSTFLDTFFLFFSLGLCLYVCVYI